MCRASTLSDCVSKFKVLLNQGITTKQIIARGTGLVDLRLISIDGVVKKTCVLLVFRWSVQAWLGSINDDRRAGSTDHHHTVGLAKAFIVNIDTNDRIGTQLVRPVF